MQNLATRGSAGEEAWTCTDGSGHEMMSSLAHVIGIAVGHHGGHGDKGRQTGSRHNHGFIGFDWDMMPPKFRPATGGHQGRWRVRSHQSHQPPPPPPPAIWGTPLDALPVPPAGSVAAASAAAGEVDPWRVTSFVAAPPGPPPSKAVLMPRAA